MKFRDGLPARNDVLILLARGTAGNVAGQRRRRLVGRATYQICACDGRRNDGLAFR
ncbi:MAG: hypothetical protein KIT13_03120 [Burkholderiales bacterium]|nr:hypothetical protein [Burkholderiales bacterium]